MGPTGPEGPQGEPGVSPAPDEVAGALATNHLEAVRGPAGAFRLVDSKGDVIGIPTGFDGWLWDPVREAFFWKPVFREGRVHAVRPPGTVLYKDAADPSCRMLYGYVDPNDPAVASWPNPVMMNLSLNSGRGNLLYDRERPTETIQVVRVVYEDDSCDVIGTPEERTGMIQLVDAPYRDIYFEGPVQLEPTTLSP